MILKKTGTLPATDSSHLKMDSWSTIVSFRDGLFSVAKRPAFLGRFPNLARDLHVAGHHFRSLGWSWFQERLIYIYIYMYVIFYAYSAGTYWNHGLICRFSCCSMFDTVKFGDCSTLCWNHVAYELLRTGDGRWRFCSVVLLIEMFIALLVFSFEVINLPPSFAILSPGLPIALSNHQHQHSHDHSYREYHLLVQSNQRSRTTCAATTPFVKTFLITCSVYLLYLCLIDTRNI